MATRKDLYYVCRKPESCPVQAHIEVAITIEVIWTSKHVEVANSRDDHEKNAEDGTVCQPEAISCIDLEVFVAIKTTGVHTDQ